MPASSLSAEDCTSAENVLVSGWKRHQAGQYELAEQLYLQVLRDNPEHANAWHLIGRLDFECGRVGRAVECMRQAISSDPGNSAFHHNLGVVLVALSDLQAASACFREAIRLRPDYVEAHNNLGNVYCALGKDESAVACYRQALSVRPGYRLAEANLAAVANMPRSRDKPQLSEQCIDRQSTIPSGDANAAPDVESLREIEFDHAAALCEVVHMRGQYAEADDDLVNALVAREESLTVRRSE